MPKLTIKTELICQSKKNYNLLNKLMGGYSKEEIKKTIDFNSHSS